MSFKESWNNKIKDFKARSVDWSDSDIPNLRKKDTHTETTVSHAKVEPSVNSMHSEKPEEISKANPAARPLPAWKEAPKKSNVSEDSYDWMENTAGSDSVDERPRWKQILLKERSDNERPLWQKILRVVLCVLTGVIVILGMILTVGIRYMFKIWDGGTMEELVFTLTGNLTGANAGMMSGIYANILIPTGIALVLFIALTLFLWRHQNDRFFHIRNAVIAIAFVAAGALSVSNAYKTLNVHDYLADQGLIEGSASGSAAQLVKTGGMKVKNSLVAQKALADAKTAEEEAAAAEAARRAELSFVDANYWDPDEVEITAPMKKRNLILIFLESMEMSYSDSQDNGGYDVNYIPELTKIAEENEDFSGDDKYLNGANVLKYSTWTMGGIFAHTAGLPLNLPIGRNQMDSQTSFLPSVTTLGDILEDQGYNQAFMCGSDVEFGGRMSYFKTHGNYDFYDLNYGWESGELPYYGYEVWWGYEDEKLFSMAKKHILEMAEKDEPFNYTMLTVDTHYPDGYMCSRCPSDYYMYTGDGYLNQYGNVLACSSKQVSEFLEWIQEQDFYENTTVVLLGDHLTMDKHFCSDIEREGYDRKTYVAYINSAVEPELKNKKRVYATEDSFPTILASLGFKIKGNKLGLGVNLFSSEETLMEQYGFDYLDRAIGLESDLFEEITSEVNIDEAAVNYNVYTCNSSCAGPDENGYFTVTYADVKSDTGISKISCAVSTYEDESDTNWYSAILQDDGTYQLKLSKDLFYYNPEGIVKIESYIYDWNWKSHMLDTYFIDLTQDYNKLADKKTESSATQTDKKPTADKKTNH